MLQAINIPLPDRFAIAWVGQFGKLSHNHKRIVTGNPYMQSQTDLTELKAARELFDLT